MTGFIRLSRSVVIKPKDKHLLLNISWLNLTDSLNVQSCQASTKNPYIGCVRS